MGRLLGQDEEVLPWLLASGDPSIRYLTLRHLLEEPNDNPQVRETGARILDGPRVRALLSGQTADGGFGVRPYKKWTGAHWRLVSLVELGVPSGGPRATAAAEQVLKRLTGQSHRDRIPTVNGLTRVQASVEGNALAVCSRLGLAERAEVRVLADSLIEWQWPDGGWNCREGEEVHHSSFYESLAPLWGLVEFQSCNRRRRNPQGSAPGGGILPPASALPIRTDGGGHQPGLVEAPLPSLLALLTSFRPS